MKKAIIVTLVCVNVALLAAMVLVSNVPPAYGQSVRGATDYMVVTGHIQSEFDAMYVLDTGARRLVPIRMNQTTKKMEVWKGRRLVMDFPER
jgi:hypothetical protein